MGKEGERQGLRERKKQATRAKLIDAAASLVGEQGYENTTVQQIADAVDVSPRTVAHYFPTKDRMLLAQVDAYAEAAAAELARVPTELSPLQALLAANVALLDRATLAQTPAAARRIAILLRTLHVSPPLQPLSTNTRSLALVTEVARRMATDPADRSVELVFAVWSSIVMAGWSGVSDLYASGQVDTAGLPAVLRQRLIDTFDEFVALTE
jgi:AcrR family transcriptional regulator